MKPLVATLLALLLPAAAFAKDFEGRLVMTSTSGKKTMPMTYFIKPGFMRVEMKPTPETTSVGLLDAATGDMTILMVEQKMYMKVSAKKVAELGPDVTVQETGRTETIAGKTCTEFVVKEKKSTTEIWATSELGGIANLGQAFGQRGKRAAWEDVMAGRNLFALRVIIRNTKGVETSRVECLEVAEETLDDAIFRIPEGYSALPGLGGMFGM